MGVNYPKIGHFFVLKKRMDIFKVNIIAHFSNQYELFINKKKKEESFFTFQLHNNKHISSKKKKKQTYIYIYIYLETKLRDS